MPGSNQYSQLSGIPETTAPVTKPTLTKPTLYKPQDWEAKAKQEKFGTTELNARQQRRFNRWQNKDAQVQDRLAFDRGEQNKLLNSMDAMRDARVAGIRAARDTQLAKLEAAKPAVVPKPEGNQGGNRGEGQGNGGGNNPYAGSDIISKASSIKVNIPTITSQGVSPAPVAGQALKVEGTTYPAYTSSLLGHNITQAITDDGKLKTVKNNIFGTPTNEFLKPSMSIDTLQAHSNFRLHNANKGRTVNIGGRDYQTIVTRGIGNDHKYLKNDRTYAYDPTTGRIRLVSENMLGMPTGEWEGDSWLNLSDFGGDEYTWLQNNPAPDIRTSAGGMSKYYTDWINQYNKAKATGFKKQGGTMNKINYFQQGGAAPQQPSMEDQVIALVQAAMQGNQQATQTIEQIMQAAQSGDQQATQIAQMIQQVMQQMQGQATSAKWGAKLGYIRSLKYAKGGKACPECEKKKVEMEACGGKAKKKAKKRYFGGLV